MKVNARKITVVAIAVIIIAGIASIPKRKATAPSQESETYTVKTEKIAKQDLQEYLLMNGNVKADNSISVYPDIGGKLVNVPVTLGTYVKRGQTIAEVDPSTPGTVYAKSPVYAPIEGYITSLPLTQGTTVSTSTAIAQIGNINKLQIEAKVPEGNIAVLRNGLTADVTLEAYKNTSFPAHISRLSPIVDETSRTKEVYFLFDTADQRINAGMYVKIKLHTVLHKDTIAIPVDAVITESGKKYVYTLNNNQTVSKTEIEPGVTVDGKLEVLRGLTEDDRIVVNGMQVLNDGVAVRDIGGK
jgi:membrane fusion protein (multidrug efflux system)